MKKIILVICVILAANGVHAQEKLIACGDPTYPPFTWKEGDKIIGVFPEVVEMIFGKLGIDVESEHVGDWKLCQLKVKSGKVDMLMAGYMTDERKVYAQYPATPVSDDPTAVFVWKGKEFPFEKWADLTGKRVGELIGSTEGQDFDEFLAKNTTVSYVRTRLQNFQKLERDRIDCTIIGLYAGLILVKKHGYEGKIIPLENPIKTEYLYFAFSKQSNFLKYLPQVDTELQKLRANGTIEKLIQKYIDYYVTTQIGESK